VDTRIIDPFSGAYQGRFTLLKLPSPGQCIAADSLADTKINTITSLQWQALGMKPPNNFLDNMLHERIEQKEDEWRLIEQLVKYSNRTVTFC